MQLRALLTDDSLRKAVGGVDKLPSLPIVYCQLMEAMGRPATTSDDRGYCRAGSGDVSEKILQLVNSACFGTTKHIARIDRAVIYLGTELIKNLALTVHVFSAFAKSSVKSGFSFEEEQQHALLTARVARRLLPDSRQTQYAFTAGLLHDIGNLILMVSAPERFSSVTACETGTLRAHELEFQMLGVTHAQVGAYLLGLWGLPDPIVEAVAFHDTPMEVAERSFDIPSATWLADALVNEQLGLPVDIDVAHLELLNVASSLSRWRTIAREEVQLFNRSHCKTEITCRRRKAWRRCRRSNISRLHTGVPMRRNNPRLNTCLIVGPFLMLMPRWPTL